MRKRLKTFFNVFSEHLFTPKGSEAPFTGRSCQNKKEQDHLKLYVLNSNAFLYHFQDDKEKLSPKRSKTCYDIFKYM